MKRFFCQEKGQSAVELAIFGSILMLVVSMIFRQGLNGGNFMNTQLKATRYALSKSFETSLQAKPGRNNASTLVIEDRLGGDFINKFGSRDRAPSIASGSGTFTNQLFYPVEKGDCGDNGEWKTLGIAACDTAILPRYDVWINGQRFPFITSNFRVITLPNTAASLAACGTPHPTDTRCWDAACVVETGLGCVRLHYQVQNYSNSDYNPGAGNDAFDPNFTGAFVPAGMRAAIPPGGAMKFMWHWVGVPANGELATDNKLDVDGDFYEETILDSTVDADGRTATVLVIDAQAGDIDFSLDGRRPTVKTGLLDDSQMFSYTDNGTYYRVQEGKLYNPRNDQYIRNVNLNDHVDIVQRTLQLNNDTQRFCKAGAPEPTVDGTFNPVEACGACFGANIQKTCLDVGSLKLFVRSRIRNEGGRSWLTQTEQMP